MSGPESREQSKIVQLFEMVGTVVVPTSEARSVWRPAGLADLYCVHPALGLAWWWETKAPGKKHTLSDAQECFIAVHDAAGVIPGTTTIPRCHFGDLADAQRFLCRLGLADPSDRDGWPPMVKPKIAPVVQQWRLAQHRAKLTASQKRKRAA